MKKDVKEYCRRVQEEMNKEDSSKESIQQVIEVAYDQCIAAQMQKSIFLSALAPMDEAVFSETVDHLFTPINWNKVKLRTLYAIRNTATGNLLTLERNAEKETFLLKESSESTDDLDYAPMLTGEHDDAKMFVKMLQEVPSDAPLGVNETMISLDIDEKINVVNLETTEVKVIY
jgi:hypothetical protein